MTKPIRAATAASEMRPKIIKAALDLIEVEGFSAVTAPRLATQIGLRRPIIYYYFEDIDEILVEAVRLAYQVSKEAAISNVDNKSATEVLWDFFSIAAAPLSELTALSLRNRKFRAVYAEIVADFRSTIAKGIEDQYAAAGIVPQIPPASIALLIQIASTALATERRLEISAGHFDLMEYLETSFISPEKEVRTSPPAG